MTLLFALYFPLIAAIALKDTIERNSSIIPNEQNYMQENQWSTEEEFLMAVFQTIESMKAKEVLEINDSDLVHSEYSPIDWSKITTHQDIEPIIKLMIPNLVNSSFSNTRHMDELNAQELFTNVIHTITRKNLSRKQIVQEYSKHFKYFVFVKNNSQEAFIDLSKKIGFRYEDESNVLPDIQIENATKFCRKNESYIKNLNSINMEHIFTPVTEILFKSKRFLAMDYLCINALGVSYSSEDSQGGTLLMLRNGIQTIMAPNTKNVFIIGDGVKTIYGSMSDDIFVLYGNSTMGNIDGYGGYNTLDFSLLETEASTTVSISHYNEKIFVYQNKISNITFHKINEIIGRKNQTDSVFVDCNIKKIQLQGGGHFLSDQINIISNYGYSCVYNLSIVLAGNTTIYEGAVHGKITHFVHDRSDSETSIHLHCSATNDISIEDTLLINTTLSYNFYVPSIELNAISRGNKSVNIKIYGSNAPCHLTKLTLYFADGFIKFTPENKMILFISTKLPIARIIEHWKNKVSSQHLIMYFELSDELLMFNGETIEFYDEYYFVRSLNIFHNLYPKSSYISLTSQLNYFDIRSNDGKPHIGEINIYCLENGAHNIIYLKNFTKFVHSKGYNELYVEVMNEESSTQDITLLINIENATGHVQEGGRITIVNGKKYNIYKTVTLEIYDTLKLSNKNNTFDLQTKSKIITLQKIMVIDPDYFDRRTRFIFNMRNIPGQLKAFNMPDSDHMVIANADPINYFVVILKNYNLYKQKFDSTTFEFFHRSNAAANIVNLIDIVREPDHIAAMYELFDESFEMTNHETTLKPYF